MIYTASFQNNGTAPNFEHNRRTKKYIEKERFTSVDLQREHITLIDLDPKEVYRKYFADALEKQNEKYKGKHNDRIISFDDWIEKIKREEKEFRHAAKQIKTDKSKNNKEKQKALQSLYSRPRFVYEAIVQIGNIDTIPKLRTDERKVFDEKMKSVFTKYVEDWQKNNPNLLLTGAYLHFDEQTPHMHLDYIPCAKNLKRGMETAPKLVEAFLQMGYEKGSMTYTPQMRWQDKQRDIICELAKEYNLEASFEARRRNGEKTVKQYHKNPTQYKIEKIAEADKKAQEITSKAFKERDEAIKEKNEAVATMNRVTKNIAWKNEIQSKQNKNIAINDKKIKSQESKLSSLKDKIQSLESYSKSIIDMATLEANEVIEKAKNKGKELINQAEEKVASMLKLGEAQKEKLIKDGEAYFDNFIEEGENEYRQIISNAKKEAKEIEDKAKTDADKIINDAKEQKKDLEKQIAIKNDSLRDIELNYDHVQNAIEEVMENIKSPDYRKQILEKNELYLLREVYSMENTIIERFKKAQLKYTEILPSDYITELNKNYKMFQKLLNDAYSQHGYEVPYPEIQPKVSQPEHDFGRSR